MREYLFRGKDKKTGEWAFGDLIHKDTSGDDIAIRIYSDVRFPVVVDNETVGQFTGKFDDKESRIFEGDIVKADFEIHHEEHFATPAWTDKYKDAICLVEFTNEQFVLKNPLSIYMKELHWAYNIEIIGNIHDNPSLLESKND